MKIWKMLLLAPIMLLALAVACNGDSSEESPEAQVPQEIIDTIDAYIRTVGLDGGTDGRPLVTDCAALGPELALCLDLSSSTISDTQAIILVFANQSDAFWELTLVKEDGAWMVTGVTSGGP